MSTNELRYSELTIDRLEEALNLITDVFYEFNAADYSETGIQEFKEFIDYDWHKAQFELRNEPRGGFSIGGGVFIGCVLFDELRMWICEDTAIGAIVGVLATYGNHLYWMFVDGKYHRRGISRKLFNMMIEEKKPTVMTVSSSPYAVDVYKKLGFMETDVMQNTTGLSYIPMKYKNQCA